MRDELDRLVERGVRGARVAAELARTFPAVAVVGRGDTAVVEAATRLRAWVVTADRELADRLRSNGVGVLMPRDKHRLVARSGVASRDRPPTARPSD